MYNNWLLLGDKGDSEVVYLVQGGYYLLELTQMASIAIEEVYKHIYVYIYIYIYIKCM